MTNLSAEEIRAIIDGRAIPADGIPGEGICEYLARKMAERPPEIYDAYAVYQSLSDKARQRTGPENVSDTLDALNQLIKESGRRQKPNGEAAEALSE